MNRYDAVVRLVENLFDLAVDYHSITVLQRPYDNHLLTLKFSTTNNQTYLLKEYHSHSPQHLQIVFSALETVRNLKPQLSFPLCTKEGLYHFSDQNDRNFQILEFLSLSPFDKKEVSLKRLFSQLEKLHFNLAHCQIPPNQYSALSSYVLLGSRKIQRRYGPDLPFLPKLESCINRLQVGSIPQGVRHGDIQETNVCLQGNEVIFVDCDDVHFGHPMMDYIQGTVMYLDQDNLSCLGNQAIVEDLWQQIQSEPWEITKQDVRYLLARVMLGPIQGGDIEPSKEALKRFLLDLEYFCEDSK